MTPHQENGQTPAVGVLLDAGDISRIISRIAHEIIERNAGTNYVLMGIPSRGYPLAVRIALRIAEIEKREVPVGALDITMYRDDLRLRKPKPLMQTLIPDDGIDGKRVVLVDDVFFSGRTIRAALDALSEIGRPASVQLAVLVDRGHRELPIRADYVGKNIPTSLDQQVSVKLKEIDGVDEVVISDGNNK